MLSKPKSAPSLGSSSATLTSSPTRSRIALPYSVRFSRCTTNRPGVALPVERRREPGSEADILRLARVPAALRRHRAHGELAQHALPGRRIGDQIVDAGRLEVDRIVG